MSKEFAQLGHQQLIKCINKRDQLGVRVIPFNINDFRSNGLIYGGSRPSQFMVQIFPPFSSSQTNRVSFFCQAASLPPFIVGQAVAPYFGAVIKYQGDRQYQDWDVTIMNDDDFPVRAMLEEWSNIMNTLISNRLDPNYYPTKYKQTATVTQFTKSGNVSYAYTFYGFWPTTISPIELNWGQTNSIETFNCTFSLDYFLPVNTGIAVDTYSGTLPSDDTGSISGQTTQGTSTPIAPSN